MKNVVHFVRDRGFVLGIFGLIGLIALIIAIQQNTNTNAQLLEIARGNRAINLQNAQILKEVQSCTDPKGACAQRGRQQSGQAVETINRISVYAAFCANRQMPPVTVKDVESCVKEQLEKNPSTPGQEQSP